MSDLIKNWRSPAVMLMVMAGAMWFSFAAWWALLNNFVVEAAGFTGKEIGILQSVREIPGFLAFTAIFVLILLREQVFALISLFLLGLGVALTGYFPTFWGLLITTMIMSIGFHYYETMAQSLSLQWLSKDEAPLQLGRIIAVGAFAQIAAYGLIFLTWETFDLSFKTVFLIAGLVTIAMVGFLAVAYPQFRETVPQRKTIVLRKRYWLYYALTFMSGARRQIFMVFAGFMMVERFGYGVHEVSALFLANCVFNMLFAAKIGAYIGRVGERTALTVEYIGLTGVFVAYAFVTHPWVAAGLYIIDHAFFALAIAMKTYFQKIADPADIAPTAGIAFTINHIAAVFIPALFGMIWLVSPEAVFLIGAGMALTSLILARMVPETPMPGREVIWSSGKATQPAE